MEFKWFYGKNNVEDCFFVRKKVFVTEQGFSEELEFDEIDDIAHHILISEKVGDVDTPIATARLFCEDGVFHCGRICVLKEYRDRHIGLIIMEQLEKKARELGASRLTLSAQTRASEFYKKAGYTQYGEEYLDEFCPHIAMEKLI